MNEYRKAIITNAIVEMGECTASQIADRLGLPISSTRTYLVALFREGKVGRRMEVVKGYATGGRRYVYDSVISPVEVPKVAEKPKSLEARVEEYLAGHDGEARSTDVAKGTGISLSACQTLLARLFNAGKISRRRVSTSRGGWGYLYWHESHEPPVEQAEDSDDAWWSSIRVAMKRADPDRVRRAFEWARRDWDDGGFERRKSVVHG